MTVQCMLLFLLPILCIRQQMLAEIVNVTSPSKQQRLCFNAVKHTGQDTALTLLLWWWLLQSCRKRNQLTLKNSLEDVPLVQSSGQLSLWFTHFRESPGKSKAPVFFLLAVNVHQISGMRLSSVKHCIPRASLRSAVPGTRQHCSNMSPLWWAHPALASAGECAF